MSDAHESPKIKGFGSLEEGHCEFVGPKDRAIARNSGEVNQPEVDQAMEEIRGEVDKRGIAWTWRP